jgi:hypothetical protein
MVYRKVRDVIAVEDVTEILASERTQTASCKVARERVVLSHLSKKEVEELRR